MSRSIFKVGKILQNYNSNIFPTAVLGRPLSYKSAISLDKLYPNSSLNLTTPSFVPKDPNNKFSGYIPIDKLKITYSCSSGPGGQNVNKVNTKVDLRFKLEEAEWLDRSIREKILRENRNKITKDGYFIIKSEVTRSQHLNLADCMKKLRDIIWQAAEPELQNSPETEERLRKRHQRAARERLFVKRADAERRTMSQPPSVHDL